MEKLFSVEQAAEVLGVHPKSVERWCRAKLIAGVRLGSLWRVSPEEIERVKREGVRGRAG